MRSLLCSAHATDAATDAATENVTPPSWVSTVERPPQYHHVRTLPRCAVVNFQKDGDHLNWKPRVAQNLSGLPARAHNFEDAFSLEEFSSTTLPVVWTATGGNPRLSITDVASDDHLDPRQHVRCTNEASAIPPTSFTSTSASQHFESSEKLVADSVEAAHHSVDDEIEDKRAKADRPRQNGWNKYASNRQLSFSANLGCSKTMTLANELRRPSFWSLLTHSRNYQHNRVRARIQTSEDVDRRREFASSPGFRKSKAEGACVSVDKVQQADADSCRKVSLLRKLVSKLERRTTSNLTVCTGMPPPAAASDCNVQRSIGDHAPLADRSTNNANVAKCQAANSHFRFNGASRDRPVRMRSKWSNAESGGKKLSLFGGRRAKSSVAGVGESKDAFASASKACGGACGDDDGNCGKAAATPDDQYLKFMTTVK